MEWGERQETPSQILNRADLVKLRFTLVLSLGDDGGGRKGRGFKGGIEGDHRNLGTESAFKATPCHFLLC